VAEDGRERRFTATVASLVDTNILIYRWDPREPRKQAIAEDLLRRQVETGLLYVPHQAIVEFMAVAPRLRWMGHPVLTIEEALREAEELLIQFPVLYPDEMMVRTALRGMATYRFSWFDAHLWAYAEHYGIAEILSEDFEHGRRYGTVRVQNPFVENSPV
jgi:predicted nucleic acid-binding protein